MNTLDNILSGSGEAVPETHERVETNSAVDASQSNEAANQEVETPEANQDESEPSGQKQVPLAALHAEKQKVKRYTEQVASFETKLEENNKAWERRFEKLIETVRPPTQQPEQVDWYADPNAAFEQNLGKAISPLSSTVSNIQTQLLRLTAVQAHGAEKVTAFENYVNEAMQRGDPEMQTLGAQMRASPDPMKTGLEWFEKRTFDPEKERERIRAELLAEIKPEEQQQTQQRPAPNLPTNLAGARNAGVRSGPAWAGPSSIDDIFNRQRNANG